MLIRDLMGKENVIHIPNEILCSHENEWKPATEKGWVGASPGRDRDLGW